VKQKRLCKPTVNVCHTLYYTKVWDRSTLPDDASRQKQVETYRLLFEKMLRNMKKLAEGGTLTPGDKQAPVEFQVCWVGLRLW
jgi:hypothetical protein